MPPNGGRLRSPTGVALRWAGADRRAAGPYKKSDLAAAFLKPQMHELAHDLVMSKFLHVCFRIKIPPGT